MLPLKVGLLLLCIKMSTSVETNGKNLADPKILLENKTLEVIVGHFPPSTIINTNDNGTTIGFDGLLIQFIDWLSHYSKFKYNLFELEKNVKGKYDREKEEWSGMIAYLVDETADLALAKFGATNKRTNGMGFAGFIDGDNTALLVDYPKAIVSYSGALEPFTGTVWMLFILGLAVMIFVSWIIIKIRVKYFTETRELKYRLNTLSDVILYFLSAFFNQGVFHSRAYQSMGFISPITWCFAAFVIVNSYTTTLTSFLSVQTRQPKINSFKDLAKFERYKVMIGRGTISHIDLLAAENGSLKIVGDRIRNCKFCLLETWEEMGRGVVGELDDSENQYVGIGMTGPLHQLILKDFIEKRYCRMTIAKEELNWKPMFLGLPVNSPYYDEINHATIWWHEMGLHSYWKRREGYPKQCLLDYGKKGKTVEIIPSTINLKNVFVAFIVLVIGYSLAFLSFIFERLFGRTPILRV